ncbi:hypothetical protein SAMN04487980_104016 [Streptomyces sp. cf124]|nr:hypothetical protein SAMN04487980_104016 [Streptomyces sp. cf124]
MSVTATPCGPNPAFTALAPVSAFGRGGSSLPSARDFRPAGVRFQIGCLPALPFVSASPSSASLFIALRTYDRPSDSSFVITSAICRTVAIRTHPSIRSASAHTFMAGVDFFPFADVSGEGREVSACRETPCLAV